MAEFILTGFGDEIDPMLDTQMEVMDSLGIHNIETRVIDGKNYLLIPADHGVELNGMNVVIGE